jgi:signal transduction histidine kinase
MALNILVLFGAVNFFYYRMKNSLSGAGLEKGSVIWSFIEGQQYELNILFAVISIISLFILFLGGIYLSHRIVGPIWRMKQDLRTMIETKKLKSINIRENDYFSEMIQDFNQLIEKVDFRSDK